MTGSADNLEITTCSTQQHGRKESRRSLFQSQSHLTVHALKGITFLFLSSSLSLFMLLHAGLTVDWQSDGVKYNTEEKWDLTAHTFDASLSAISARGVNKQLFH